jgi:uncharacterized protein YraI
MTDMVQCPGCNFWNRPGVRFCEACARVLVSVPEIPPVMLCPSCGIQLREGVRFCGNCGITAFVAPSPVVIPTHYPQPTPEANKVRWIIPVLAVIVGFLALLLLGGLFFVVLTLGRGRNANPPTVATQNSILINPAQMQGGQVSVDPIRPTDTPQPSWTFTFIHSLTSTLTPSLTMTLTPTLGMAAFTAVQSSNCRSGPTNAYPIVSGLDIGKTVPIQGKSDPQKFGNWWYVNVDGVRCWAWADLGTASGNLVAVPLKDVPPTPTPTATPIPWDQVFVYLYNNSNTRDLCEFYLSSDGVNWGPDLLPGTSYLGFGQQTQIFPLMVFPCTKEGDSTHECAYYKYKGCSTTLDPVNMEGFIIFDLFVGDTGSILFDDWMLNYHP